jgi:hypothetical protein
MRKRIGFDSPALRPSSFRASLTRYASLSGFNATGAMICLGFSALGSSCCSVVADEGRRTICSSTSTAFRTQRKNSHTRVIVFHLTALKIPESSHWALLLSMVAQERNPTGEDLGPIHMRRSDRPDIGADAMQGPQPRLGRERIEYDLGIDLSCARIGSARS